MMNKKITTSLLLTGLLIYVPISTSFAVDPAPAAPAGKKPAGQKPAGQKPAGQKPAAPAAPAQ
jgi:hypothetical protein